MTQYKRPSWDNYFLQIAQTVGTRSTCDRARIGGGGCVITKDNRIMVTGYAGSPPNIPHCDDIGHEMKKVTHEDGSTTQHCMRTTHAEQNAICQAAKLGISIDGGTLYCFMTPCYTCAKLLITAGIKRIVAQKDYHAADDSKKLFRQAGISLTIREDVQMYEKQ
ncbi:MAG: deoxycytidylate deaminase [Candidatus Woesearchaeota archaeon]